MDVQAAMGADDRLKSLSPGQLAVLKGVARYQSSKEIARDLKISPHTVDQRIKRIQAKLGVATRAEAARLYMTWLGRMEELNDSGDWSALYNDQWASGSQAAASAHDAQAHYFSNSISGLDTPDWSSLFKFTKTPIRLDAKHRTFAIVAIMLVTVVIMSAIVTLVQSMSKFY